MRRNDENEWEAQEPMMMKAKEKMKKKERKG